MLGLRPPVSAYLAEHSTPAVRSYLAIWRQLRAEAGRTSRHHPHLLSRSLMALTIWCLIVGAYQAGTQFSFSGSNANWSVTSTGVASQPGGHPVSTPLVPAKLALAQAASRLPNGPSGQLLPPGTMAPDRTYPNTYARGQCTWYVAGRRQIPSSWQNAAQWYYHASASGWSVGTVPAVAAIAWTPRGYYGHVALVEQVSADAKQVYISEMNYRGIGIKSFRWVPATDFKYIY